MPMYDYVCTKCHFASEEYLKMNSTSPVPCPRCNYLMIRVPSVPHTDLKEYHTPIEMNSIGMTDLGEIRAFKQACPDVDVSDDPDHPNYGIPIARSRKAKLQALDAAGFVETK